MSRGKHVKKNAHRFLRRVVRLCLVMMCFLTLSVALLAWHSGEQLSSATVTALMGGWCGELLMSLLKRRLEREETEVKSNDKSNDFEGESI